MAGRVTLIVSLLLCTAGATAAHVPIGYRIAATEYALPPTLLYAVALTESRRPLDDGRHVPWPWTLNIEGKAYYNDRKAAAAEALQNYLARGRSVAVGLMQQQWRRHALRLRNAAVALDPYNNLRLGAAYLAECHRRRGSWSGALACYL